MYQYNFCHTPESPLSLALQLDFVFLRIEYIERHAAATNLLTPAKSRVATLCPYEHERAVRQRRNQLSLAEL